MPDRLRQSLPLVSILTLAAVLRLWGIHWGVPSATHYFSYHPDESVVLGVATAMDSLHGQLLPHFYNYGSLQLYLVNFADTLAFVFGGVNLVAAGQNPADYGDWAKLLLIGRMLTVAMGIGTIWATYALGHRLFGRRAGLLAALTLAVTPLHAQHSHWLTVDVPATFWAVLSLVWAARLATGDEKPMRAAVLAGVFAGLAAATKYNLALVVLAVPLTRLLRIAFSLTGERIGKSKPTGDTSYPLPREGEGQPRSGRVRGRGGAAALLLASALLAFLLACPGAILEHAKFLEALRFEAVHVQNADDATFRGTGSGFVYHVVANLSAGMGWPLLLFALVSVGYAAFRRQRGDGLLAAFALPYYVLIGLAAVRYARYTIPLLPILAVWVGRLADDVLRWEKRRPDERFVGLFAGGPIFLLTLFYALSIIRPMASLDNRDWAFSWVRRLVPPTAAVGFPTMPWFQTVPLSPYFPAPARGAWRRMASPKTTARIIYQDRDWDADLLTRARPELVVLSEYDYDDALDLGAPAARYFEILGRDYRRAFVLSDVSPAFSGYKTVGGMPTRRLPHDMLYPNPIITIYQRKKP